jgi:hypothetical protein
MHCKRSPYISWVFAAISLGFAFFYYYAAVIDIDFFDTRLPALSPGPDGQEYFATAINYIRDGSFKLVIGDNILPSRYPPGYSATLVPFVYMLNGEEIVLAPFVANRTIGILILLSIFGFFVSLGRFYAAGISVALMSTLPSFVNYSRSAMSENLGALLVLWTYLLVYLALKKDSIKILALAAFTLGLAVTTRLALLFFAGVLAANFLINSHRNLRQKFSSGTIIVVCFIAGAAPFFIQNWANFGNPFMSGYEFWVPNITNTFSFSTYWDCFEALWKELTLQRDVFIASNLFGNGTHFTPLYFLVVLVALVEMLRRLDREKAIIAGSVLITIAILASFQWIHLRKFYPHQVLSVCLVANFYQIAIDSSVASWHKHRQRATLIALFCIVTIGFIIAGYPSQSGWKPGEVKSQFVDLLDPKYLGVKEGRYEAIRRIPAYLSDEDALIIIQSRIININLATSLLPENMTVVPQDGKHRYGNYSNLVLGINEIDNFTLNAYSQDQPIYYIGADDTATDALNRLRDLIPGSQWQTLEQDKLVYLACLETGQGFCPQTEEDPALD